MEFRVFSSFNLVMEKKSLAKTEAIYQALYTMEQLFLKSFFFFLNASGCVPRHQWMPVCFHSVLMFLQMMDIDMKMCYIKWELHLKDLQYFCDKNYLGPFFLSQSLGYYRSGILDVYLVSAWVSSGFSCFLSPPKTCQWDCVHGTLQWPSCDRLQILLEMQSQATPPISYISMKKERYYRANVENAE